MIAIEAKIRIAAEILSDGVYEGTTELPGIGTTIFRQVAWRLPWLPARGDRVQFAELQGMFYVDRVHWRNDMPTLVGSMRSVSPEDNW